MTPRAKNVLQVNVAVLMWAGTAMFAKGIHLPTTDIVCVRSLIAAAALFVFLRATGGTARVKSPAHLAGMIGLGLLLGAHWLTYFQALKISTAAVALVSLHTYPVITALIEPFLFGEKLKKADVLLAAGVLAGVAIMTPAMSLANDVTRGILLGIFSGLCFMTRNLLTRKFVREYSSSALMFWQTLVTGAVLVPVVLWAPRSGYSPGTVGLLVLLGIVFTAVPQTLFASGLQHLSAKTVGILATLLPFYAAFMGYLIHDEKVTARTALGGLVVLACIICETVKNARTPAPDEASTG